jgi:outer membrane lipoprotein carrier protein
MKMYSAVKVMIATVTALAGFGGMHANAHANAMDDFRGFLTNTQSARSEFSQTVYDSRGKVTQQASGTLAFARPGKFRWQYVKPAQTIVGDGSKVSFYDADLNQVTVRKLEKAFSSTPAALLAGKSEVEAAFTLVAGGEADGMDWVNAEPKSKDAGIETVRMGFVKGQLAAMELLDSFGNRTRIVFNKFERNAKIDAKEFTFVAPKGADVISE